MFIINKEKGSVNSLSGTKPNYMQVRRGCFPAPSSQGARSRSTPPRQEEPCANAPAAGPAVRPEEGSLTGWVILFTQERGNTKIRDHPAGIGPRTASAQRMRSGTDAADQKSMREPSPPCLFTVFMWSGFPVLPPVTASVRRLPVTGTSSTAGPRARAGR